MVELEHRKVRRVAIEALGFREHVPYVELISNTGIQHPRWDALCEVHPPRSAPRVGPTSVTVSADDFTVRNLSFEGRTRNAVKDHRADVVGLWREMIELE
jgi:hypothetical protein